VASSSPTRDYYRQRRQRQVEDKSAPTAELPDF
jgi:hypothetical protein